MASATEQLRNMIVTNPGINLNRGDVCFFMASAQIGKPYDKTTVTTKQGPGIGVTVPVTKHFGLGLFKRQVTTEVKTETKWQKTPCTLYVLCEKFALSVGKNIYYIDNKEITEMSIHKDAFVIGSKNYSFYLFMAGRDIEKLQTLIQLIKQSQAEGSTMADFGYIPSRQSQIQPNSSVIQNNKADAKTAQSDYAKTIFLWAFSKKANPVKKRDEYPSYCFYELGIQNAKAYHEQLIKDGYFEEAKAEDILDTFKADKLKEILSAYKLDTKGKKDVLIRRITENVPSTQIALLISEKLYVISAYGVEYLSAHNDYVTLHQHNNWSIGYQEYDAMKSKNPSFSFFDACWSIFNTRILEHRGNINLVRNEYYNMYQLLECENKKFGAMELLLQVFYIDVNINKMFAPGIIKDIGDHDEFYKPEYVDKLYSSVLPQMSCDKDTFKDIICSIIRGDFSEDAFAGRLR